MASAPNSLSQASPVLTNLIEDCFQLSQNGNGVSCADPNGPYGKLLADLEKLVQSILHPNSGTDMQPLSASSQPSPYSTDSMPSNVQNDPMSQFSPDTLDRAQSFSNAAMLASPASGDGFSNGGADTTALSQQAAFASPVTESVDPNTGAIVRDHRHPIPTDPSVGWTQPPAAPPSSAVPPSSGFGSTFTSSSDYSALEQANSSMESAKQAALADPTDPAKQLAFQEAAQTLQLLFNMLQQLSSMKASMADAAIKAIKVNAA